MSDPIVASEGSLRKNDRNTVSDAAGTSELSLPLWKGKSLDSPPPWTFPVPFVAYTPGPGRNSWDQIWGPPPRTLAELRMYKLSWAIRSKENWQVKQENFPDDEQLTSNMINYIVMELEGYEKISDQDTGIQRGCFDAIWYSDMLISNDLSEAFKSAAAQLDNGEKDWHRNSDGLVLDLVHPSLYCVVYGRTRAFLPDTLRTESNLLVVGPPARGTSDLDFTQEFTLSQKRQRAARFVVYQQLEPVLHKPLYPINEEILARFVPLFERVLGDSNTQGGEHVTGNGRIRTRRQDATWPDEIGYSSPMRHTIPCIWGVKGIPSPDGGVPAGMDNDQFYEEFYANAPKTLPESYKIYKGALEKDFSPISLRGRTIQCIVKLANIHLTPEKPEYKGGSWHVEGLSNRREGMFNESIVASGIYYYDEDNISESTLSFRVTTATPAYHYQDDDTCMEILYDMPRGCPCVQELGSMITKQGRTLAWPNLFQHRVSPFRLTDPTKPGHRKILAFFLVNPATDPIVSATDVPLQQAEWTREAFAGASAATAGLPQELRDYVEEYLTDTLMTRKGAEAYRLELMKERTSFTVEHEKVVVQQPFDMCEH
ncbi:hypothetical protein DFH09DRAFT_1307454 [Mycena vulgaris]|nr:hypothetical protein DFH09DRAFT_1307454 [Mycena vulgaris]